MSTLETLQIARNQLHAAKDSLVIAAEYDAAARTRDVVGVVDALINKQQQKTQPPSGATEQAKPDAVKRDQDGCDSRATMTHTADAPVGPILDLYGKPITKDCMVRFADDVQLPVAFQDTGMVVIGFGQYRSPPGGVRVRVRGISCEGWAFGNELVVINV